MRKTFVGLLTAALLMAGSIAAEAADKPSKKTAQVKSDLYVTALEAHDILSQDDAALLIDVRDPIEIMFTGFATGTDIHVPYRISDRTKWNSKKNVYAMEINPNFAEEVQARLTALGASKDSKLIFICRSGSTRSAPAADIFYDLGYRNAYTVVDGFEGGKMKGNSTSKGVRAVNGWRNSGLPWGYKLDQNVMYGLN